MVLQRDNFPHCLILFILLAFLICMFKGDSELTTDTFDKHITQTGQYTLVMFYAPWCPHCQEAKPKFLEAAKQVKKGSPFKDLAQIDCDNEANAKVCQSHNIEGYPTLKLYYEGRLVQEYEDEIIVEKLVEFMKSPAKPGEVPVTPRSTEEHKDIYMPDVAYLGPVNFTSLVKSKTHVLVFFYTPWCPNCSKTKEKYQEAAKNLVTSFDKGLAAVNCDLNENTELCGREKVDGFPTIRYYREGEIWADYFKEMETKAFLEYLGNPPESKEEITRFDDINLGGEKHEQYTDEMKSVLQLTAESFNQQTQKMDQYTLVMFYAHWCAHCQAIKPGYDLAAKKIKDSSKQDRVIAAIDCSTNANEVLCDKEHVEGYPTVILYRDGMKSQIYQESPITTEGIVSFMLKLADLPKQQREEL